MKSSHKFFSAAHPDAMFRISVIDARNIIDRYAVKRNIKIMINGDSSFGESQVRSNCEKFDNPDLCLNLKQAEEEVQYIQQNLGKDEVVGYIFTSNTQTKRAHFEVLIITHDKIIKPVHWYLGIPEATFAYRDLMIRRTSFDGNFYSPGDNNSPITREDKKNTLIKLIFIPKEETLNIERFDFAFDFILHGDVLYFFDTKQQILRQLNYDGELFPQFIQNLNERIKENSNTCELIRLPSPPTLEDARIAANAAYVRCDTGQLFYVNKALKICTDLELSAEAIAEFDKKFKPSDQAKVLYEYILKKIIKITGHTHLNSDITIETLQEPYVVLSLSNFFMRDNLHISTNDIINARPQATDQGCGALGLLYLKELLKNNAEQLHEDTLSFPYYLPNGELKYYFFPSPQVLRYSQSGLYNEILKAMISDQPVLSYKGSIYLITTLREMLERSIIEAQKKSDKTVVQENSNLLDKLTAFQKQWLEKYENMVEKRQQYESTSSPRRNTYLAYRSAAMFTITSGKSAAVAYQKNETLCDDILRELLAHQNNRLVCRLLLAITEIPKAIAHEEYRDIVLEKLSDCQNKLASELKNDTFYNKVMSALQTFNLFLICEDIDSIIEGRICLLNFEKTQSAENNESCHPTQFLHTLS